MKSIWVHTLVKNEENFIWFSVMGVINFVDKVLIWDTGSTDNTVKIIEEIKKRFPEQIDFREVGKVGATGFTKVRQEMLNATKGDWVLVLDGDEVWWEESIAKVIEEINRNECDAIISPFTNPVGDIFHYQEENAGKYRIDGRIGNVTIRAFRRGIKGLKLSKDYGEEGFIDGSGKFIQESENVKRKYLDASFLHLTHLQRSSKEGVMQRGDKLKHELGIPFPADYCYPEVFFRPRPRIVELPWQVMEQKFKFRAFFETPLRKIKRRVWWGKLGY